MPPWSFDFGLVAEQKIAGTWFEIGPQYSPGLPEYLGHMGRELLQHFFSTRSKFKSVFITDFPRADKNWQC